MDKSQNKIPKGRGNAYLCNVCGKEGKSDHIKDHIEANHLEGIIIPCNLCGKTFCSRASLRMHKHGVHTAKAKQIFDWIYFYKNTKYFKKKKMFWKNSQPCLFPEN